MEIKVCTTAEWTDNDWVTYVSSFNEVFGKQYDQKYFRSKYTNVVGGVSFHALLLDENKNVVGGCSVLPCLYNRDNELFLNGLAVDVFILTAYRTDPLMLRRMYSRLKKLLCERNVVAVMAVPNATAYPYWKNVVKWKDVGSIRYWALPIKVGNVLNKCRFLNVLSNIYAHTFVLFSSFFSFFRLESRHFRYRISSDDKFMRHRYDGEGYTTFSSGELFYAYRVVDEDGVRVAYLLDANRAGIRSFKVCLKAVRDILKKNVDLVLFVGTWGFFQPLFIKIPRRLEPKVLPLTCDLLMTDSSYSDMYQMENWDFGLRNYDVR